jgi:hypothetical protein
MKLCLSQRDHRLQEVFGLVPQFLDHLKTLLRNF